MNPVFRLLTAETLVHSPIQRVWEIWTEPKHIMQWNNTSADWHTLKAENDVKVGGKMFLSMQKKDGTDGFDYACIYNDIIPNKMISLTTDDGRKSTILFTETENGIRLTETFEPESKTPLDIQQQFCQAILDNFKVYTEGQQEL